MRVLVTGAHGQVGRALLATPPECVDVVPMGHAELDIATADAVDEAVQRYRPDVIINVAAYTAVDLAESEPQLAYRTNVDGPRCLASVARDHGIRVLHVSSDYVFDGSSPRPYHPDSPTNPLNVYGKTKRLGESVISEMLPDRSAILRTSWVYAASGTNFVRTMLRTMRDRRAVKVVTDQIGTPTAARTVAEALWAMALRPNITGVYHWTDAGVASWYDFAVAIAEEAESIGLLPRSVEITPISSAEYPAAAQRPPYSVLDKSSTMATLQIRPVHWRVRLRQVLAEIQDV